MSNEARDRAEEVFEDWISRRRLGAAETKEQLLGAHPDLRDALLARIRGLDALQKRLDAEKAASRDEGGGVLIPGGRLGRYRLEREIGEGGMGVVWLAHDPLLEDKVALKFLPKQLLNDPMEMALLREEAKVMRGLTHEGIVRLHTFDVISGLPFLVEEYLAGDSLAKALRGRALAAAEAIWLLEQIAPALDYAHGQNVTHRDVKPGNLLLTETPRGALGSGPEQVKVGDFGLAFVASSMMSMRSDYNPSGTLPYMSPEVLMGRRPSPAADVYSVGATIFEIVSGRPPFHSGDVRTQIRYKLAPPLESGDPALDAAVAAALAKNPASRPSSVAAMARLARSGAIQVEPRAAAAPRAAPAAPSRARRAAGRGLRAGTVVQLLIVASGALGAAYVVQRARTSGEGPTDVAAAVEAPAEIRIEAGLPPDGEAHTADGRLVLHGSVARARGDGVQVALASEAQSRFVPFETAGADVDARWFTCELTLASSDVVLIRADGAASPLRIPVTVDREPPRLSDLAPEPAVYAPETTIAVRAEDEHLASVVLDGEPMRRDADGVFVAGPLPLAAGEPSTFEVVATDRAGNASELLVRRRAVPQTVVRAQPSEDVEVSRWEPLALALDFDPPVREFELADHAVELSAGGAQGRVVLDPPAEGFLWKIPGSGVDLGGRAIRVDLVYDVGEPLRAVTGPFRVTDATQGFEGWPLEIEHTQVPGLRLRLVPPGTYRMGDPESPDRWERGRREVTIARPFYMSVNKVTIRQFSQVTARPGGDGLARGGMRRPGDEHVRWEWTSDVGYVAPIPHAGFAHAPTYDHPATQVSYWDAIAFCEAFELRLPTEAEWEYVCRGGGDVRWWIADDGTPLENLADASLRRILPPELYGLVVDAGRHDDGHPFTAPVGTFRPNPWGFHDLMGNAREWTLDAFDPWIHTEGSAVDPYAAPRHPGGDASPEAHVIRGADWFSPPMEASATDRYFEPPQSALDFVGFRVVHDPFARHALPKRKPAAAPSDWLSLKLARYPEGGGEPEVWRSKRTSSGYLDFPDAPERTARAVRRWGAGKKPLRGNVRDAARAALDWLAEHQRPEGHWDGSDLGCGVCTGAGFKTHDVGLTALALLAFLADGSTPTLGRQRVAVANATTWLLEQQVEDEGLIGTKDSDDFIYNHALATLALAELCAITGDAKTKQKVQRAVDYIQAARNPYAAWRYDWPPVGDNDTSVTGWMICALVSAQDAGLIVDEAALQGGLSFIEEVSDPATGRVGYDSFGSLSSRTTANEHFPREKGEAMTAVGLLCRLVLGQERSEHEIVDKHVELLKKVPPEWDPDGFGCDMYYWFFGTMALSRVGGKDWDRWKASVREVLLQSQRKDGHEAGSWKPAGPWGYVGGRVYSTALCALTLMETG